VILLLSSGSDAPPSIPGWAVAAFGLGALIWALTHWRFRTGWKMEEQYGSRPLERELVIMLGYIALPGPSSPRVCLPSCCWASSPTPRATSGSASRSCCSPSSPWVRSSGSRRNGSSRPADGRLTGLAEGGRRSRVRAAPRSRPAILTSAMCVKVGVAARPTGGAKTHI
jgi:hypothetical protein